MNENLNLEEILKDCQKGTKLYSTVYGEVEFNRINKGEKYPIRYINSEGDELLATTQGLLIARFDGECTLFPSKEQRDWSEFTAPWYKKEMDTNNMSNKDDERLRKTAIGFIKDFAEQHDALMKAMNDAGYKWNPETKILEKLIETKFKVGDKLVQDKFDPKTLQSFDKVLVRDDRNEKWQCSFFSYININDDIYYPYVAINTGYKCCIPYNDDTKHLVGTTDEAPEYYIYWEE